MNTIDHFLLQTQIWIRSKPLLYRFTLGTRILLSVGFIPTGLVKLLGFRFTVLSIESDVGMFFETLYQSGIYWKFLGLTQILAGIFVLIPATSALGALLFIGIMINIFLITVSYDFAYTPVITFQMLLASLWLILWDYNRFRGLLFSNMTIYAKKQNSGYEVIQPQLTLENSFERAVYVTGTIAGLIFFGILRGLVLPSGFDILLLSVCLACFFIAIVFGIRNAKR